MKTIIATSVFFAAAALASPIQKRAISDADILNYALTLEHLEDVFYRGALARFTQAQFVAAGFADPFYANLKQISAEETTHVTFLTAGLTAAGAKPVAECTYSFPYTTPGQFVSLAKMIEGVGVSAYIGAAGNITTKAYLLAAAEILTVEARHTAYLRAQLRQSPFPGAFDTALDFNEVYTLAAQFITSCPSTNVALPVAAFPTLTFTTSTQATSGTTGQFQTSNELTTTTGLYLAFISGMSVVYQPATVAAKVSGVAGRTVSAVIPPSMLDGQVYALLTTASSGMVLDSAIVAGPAIVEIALPGATPLSS